MSKAIDRLIVRPVVAGPHRSGNNRGGRLLDGFGRKCGRVRHHREPMRRCIPHPDPMQQAIDGIRKDQGEAALAQP